MGNLMDEQPGGIVYLPGGVHEHADGERHSNSDCHQPLLDSLADALGGCEMDGVTDHHDDGRELYWHCEEPATRVIGGMAVCDEHAAELDGEDGKGEGFGWCGKHGPQPITGCVAFTGYAGGRCYAATLACGCTELDESDDVRAAR